jgi:Mn2+/Fe2+ NRAMP family transporter
MFTRNRDVMKAQVNTRVTNGLAIIVVGVITAMNVVLLAQYVLG